MLGNNLYRKIVNLLQATTGADTRSAAHPSGAIEAMTLEDRVLYSATPLLDPEADGGLVDPSTVDTSWQILDLVDLPPDDLPTLPVTDTNGSTTPESSVPSIQHELVLIDAQLDDLEQLVNSFLAREDATHDIEIVYLNRTQDGFAQVDQALVGDTKFDAIHFVTHGADGMIRLGGSWLDANTIEQRLDQIQGWADSLTNDADLLFYGCDFAADELGQSVVDRLSEVTGADVAASDDATGTATRGGDWLLEYATGVIDVQLSFDESLAGWENLLATYVVTTTADSGAGSLRQAITDANNNAGADTITFNIGSGTVQTINLLSALPWLQQTTTIDGTTETGYAGTPLIELNGASAGVGADGLRVDGANSVIRGLILNRFTGSAIYVSATGGGVTIAGNYIGTNSAGTAGSANGGGILIANSSSNTVGGLLTSDRNVISGNTNYGVLINGSGTSYNLVIGNYIGTNAAGTAGVGNATGVQLGDGVTYTTIGGTTSAARNVISGNSGNGIVLTGSNNQLNTVAGNYVGLNAAGTGLIGNLSDGIRITSGAHDNMIGGTTTASRNVIGGNSDGIQVNDASANTIQNNYIGLDPTGTFALGNTDDGIDIDGGTGTHANFILDNYISGNTADGIDIGSSGTNAGNIIRDNWIGLKGDGVSALGNGAHGILIESAGTANFTVIGGTAAAMANTIANNGGDGISITGTSTNISILRNSIYGNTGTAIDLNNDGITINDIGDADTGPNGYLNTPMLGSAVNVGGNLVITGTYAGPASSTIRLEFFSTPNGQGDSGGYGEAKTYLGTHTITTDANGRATYTATLAGVMVNSGASVTGTATLSLGGGNFGSTSEFAGNILADNPNLFVTGSYTGNGIDSRSILGLGFRPEVVIVVQRNSGQIGVIRTSLMSGDVSKPLTGATGLTANLIQTLEGDGFTIGTDARVNTNGTVYDYMAFGAGSDIQIGAYTGNGTSQSIAGIGFQPELTFFMSASTGSSRFNSSLSVTNTFNFDNTSAGTNGVSSYGSDGFSVSSGAAVNASSVAIYYVAFNQSTNYFTQGSYTGNATDNRNIAGLGFSPEAVFVRQLTSSANWVPFHLDSAGPTVDMSQYMDGTTGTYANIIQSLQTDGFQIGTDVDVNTNGQIYGYFAFKQRDILYAPVNTVPAPQTTNEDTNRVFSSGNGNQISIADADAGTSSLQITLSVTNGALTLNGTTGLTFTSGDGSSDASMIFTGSLTNINNALNGLSYIPTADYAGGATLTITSRDATLYSLDIDSGLVARYTFEGNANDVAPGTAQNGSLVNGPTYTTDATRGQVLSLDGVNDFVQISSVFSNPTNITIGGWVNLLSAGGRKEFISLDDRIHIALDDTAGVKGSIQTGVSTWLDVNSNQFISGTGWHHVMFTFSDTDNYLRLYIDGVQVASTTTTSSIYWTGATTTYIGRHPTATVNFPNALVDDVRIYNRAITADEVAHLARDLALVATDAVAITVNPVNDAPTATITPTTYAVNEQATLTLHGTGLSIADIDAASGSVRATLSVVSGTITATAGTTGVTVSGSGTNTVTLTGTLTQINNLLAGNLSSTLTYTINSDTPPASDTLTLTANDQGNTGSGGALTGSDTATINITALNDAPTATITPTTYAVNEQATLTLHGTGLSIADVDAASSTVRATLSVVSGTITATAGTTGVTISGSGTNTVTLTGTLTQINNLLAGNLSSTLTYTINSDTPPGSDTLTLIANDQGNTGSGGSLTATDTATINITALNDAPTATITPTTYAVNEQATLTLHGTGLSIADVDAASSTVRATLSVVSGTISATAGTTGVTVSGSGTNTVTLTGTLTQINNLLAGNLSSTLTYTINSDTPPASDTLTLTANDQGNTGSGGALTANDTATINITALNDAPTATITPTTYAVNEQATLTLHGTGLSIADVDAASSSVQATLSVVSGTISATAGTTGVTVSGSGTNTVTLTGTLTQINNLLAGNLSSTLTYTINSDTPPASDTLTLTANDQGNTGSGGALTANDTATINITALNDAPTATITPTTYAVNEQATLTLHGTGLSIADVDAASSSVQATLSVVSGTITATAGTTGVTVSGSGTNTVTLTGTLTQINNLLAGNLSSTLTYTINSDTPPASDTLTLTANDQGNTGSGGALTANDTAAINITALNDAPTAVITPTAYGVNEQVSVLLSGTGLSIADADAASGTMSVTLSVGEGTLTVTAGSTGATVNNSGTSTVTITGTVTQINNLLAGNLSASVTYINSSDTPSASTTLTLAVNDQGNTGSGGALTASDTAAINITAINDAPTAVITPTTYAVNEQATLTLHGTGLSIADVDAASGTMSVTLSVGEGTLTVAAGSTGATVSNSGTSTVTITGTVTQINNLLAGNSSATVTYANSSDTPSASTTLTLAVNDQGNTGSGGSLTANDTATINITAINDAPTATITPTTYSVNEQATLTLHGTGLSIADVDAASGTMSVTLSVGEGTLTVAAGSTGATVSNSGTSTVTITGTVTQINNLLAGNSSATVTYLNPLDNPAASTTLTLSVNDQGNTGSGGSLTANDTATINITPINDAPTTSDVNASGAEDSTSVAITLVGADVDGTVTQFQLSGLPANGTLYLDAGLTTTVSAGVNYAATGQQLTLYFAPQADWNGVTTFQYYAIDNLSLADSSPNTATITITAVNDAPTITSNGGGNTANVSIIENTTGVTTVAASDIDLPAQTLTYSIVAGGDGAFFTIDSNTGALTFTAAPDFENPLDAGGNNVYDVTVQVSDGVTTDTQVISVTVTNGNETPTATITPTSYSVNEQATLTLHGTGLSIADSDAGGGTMSVTLSVGEGTLNVSAGSTGVSVSNSGTSSVTITGTVTQINDLLAGNLSGTVTYIDNTDTPSASTTLTLLVNDQGNSGAGGALTATDTATINIAALNDAPVSTITPTTYSVNEQATLTLHGTGLAIADADAASGTMSVTLSVGEGTLTVTAGSTGASVSGSGTDTVTLTGTVTQINNLLAGNSSATVTYIDNTDTPSASTTLTMTVNDQGNTGSGGSLTSTDTATINITALNDAPVSTITPTSYSINEQATLTLHGTGLSISDADAAFSTMSVTLSVGEGTLTVSAGSTGASVSGSGTSTVTITGSASQINNLLAGNLSASVTYIDNTDTPSASTTLTMTVNDQGNTGSGGSLTSTDTATINITALNDAPVSTITPTSYSVNEQATLTLHGTGLAISDADAASGTMSITLSVGEGTLTVTAGSTGATVSGSGTGTVTLTGTVTQINNLLAGNLSGTVTYVDNTDTPSASTTLTMTVNDQGNTGSGGSLTATDTATINITALNDAPVSTITPTSYSVNEQATLTLHGTGLAISDADAASGTMSVTLSVGSGTLTVAAGSTGATVSGSGTSTVTVTGTLTQINNLLAGNSSATVDYILNSDTPVASTTLTMTVNDQGNTGSGGSLTSTDTATINITALNDAPVSTITPTTYSVNEQATLTLHGTGLSIADADAASGTMSVTLSVGEGTLTVTAGSTGATVSGSGTGTVTVTGTVTQINNLLAGNLSGTVTYVDNTDTPSASTTLTMTVNDQGNTGSGGSLTSTDTATINITALNDAPVSTITPTSYSVNEQTTLTLHGTGLAISDADALGGTMSVTLSVGSGTLTVAAGSTGASVSGSGTSTVTVTGTVTQINNLLAGNNSATVDYILNSDTPAASTTLTMTVNDQGNTGSGGSLTSTDTATINITAINDAPISTITPTSYNVNEATTLTLHGTGLSIADADAASGTMSVTLSVGEGTLTVTAGSTGATVTNSGTSNVTITGTVTQINNLLVGNNSATVTYINNLSTPAASTTLTLSVNDQGNTGSGGSLTSNDTATINIGSTNDAPTATITPTSYSVNEQATLTLHGTGLTIGDVDAGGASVEATLSVVSGTISAAAGSTGVTVSGSGTNTVTLTGTLTQINNLLAGNLGSTLTYTLNSDTPPASDTLTLAVNDLGNSGSGGALTGNDTAAINITAVNDAPTSTITPTSYTVNEQTTLNLHGTGLSIADVDAASGTMRVTLSVGTGTLTVAAGSTGATVSGSGTSTVTITGTLTQINNLLAGNNSGTVDYILNSDTPAASTTLTMTVNDQGNTGSGGSLTSTDTAAINITAVNDAPVATITPTSYSVNEQATLTLHGTGLAISDADAASGTMSVTLSVGEGALTVTAGSTGVTVSNSGTSTVTLTGTVTQINNLLAGNLSATVTYVDNTDTPSASTTLTLSVNDQGNTGSGGSLTASDAATINITALNDAPTATITPTSYTVNEQTTLSLHGTGLTIADADALSGTMRITLSVGTGTLTVAAGSTGVTVSGSGTATVTLTGTLTQLNDLLAGNNSGTIDYILNSDTPSASTTLTMTVNDQGNTGSGGSLTATDTATINISAVNDAPTATITPTSYTVNEQATLTLHGTGLTIADVDAASGAMRVTLSVGEGTLSIAAGSTGATVTGSGTSTVTITGTITQINNLLAGNLSGTLTYVDNTNTPSASTTLTMTVNDQGNTGSGGSLLGTDTATINITALNDAPTATITPTSYTVNEQATLTLHGTGLAIADADALGGTMSVTLSVGQGTLTINAGSTNAVVTNSGTSSVTITGTVAEINDLLAGNLSGTVTYTNSSDTPSASTTLTLSVNDQGNTGSGGSLTANDTATINITALNDAPTATITPTSYSVNEATTLTLHGTGLAIADVDAASGTMRITLSVGEGTLTVTAGSTGATVTGSGTSTVTITGTVTQVNNLLAGNNSATVTYINNVAVPAAATTLTMTVNDQGNTGSGGSLLDTDTATINIGSLNDAPTATITPTTYTVNEQATLNLHGTGLSLADIDANGASVEATVSVVSGTINAAAGSTGVTISGSGTNTVTLTGTLTQINNLLAGNLSSTLTYTLSSDTPPASDTLTLAVNDLGNTGSGGALTGSDTATINITAVNDAPTATITPTSYSVNEQTTLSLHGTGLAIADVDAASGTMRITLSVGSGTLTVAAGSTGVTVSGSGTATVTLTGTLTQLNDLLAGNNAGTIDYLNSSDTPAASTTLTMTVNDQGNTGSGGSLTATDTATINITALNDAPVATITPNSYTVNEQTTLTLDGTGLSIADVDASGAIVVATLSVGEGTLTASAGSTGATVSGSGTSTLTITGTVTQINNVLAGSGPAFVSYIDNTDAPSASTTLTLSVNDQGNTGSGGALTGSDTATININNVNDPPVINNATFSLAENTANTTIVGSVPVTDPDAGDTHTYSITAGNTGGAFAIDNNGQITVANAAALDFETTPTFTLTVRVQDAAGAFDTATVTVNLTDVNEFAVGAVFDNNGAANQVNENSVNGTTVGLTARAIDGDPTDTVTYTLDDSAGGLFSIDLNTGVVRVAGSLNAETAQSHTIIVRATSSDTSYSTQSFTINILDVNEFPIGPVSDADSATNEVNENANVGTVVGVTALAVDTDVTATVTYSLTSNPGGRFAIDANTGVVTVAGALDAETATSYTITVRATSSDLSFSSQSFVIAILDVNEAAVGAISDTNAATNQVSEAAAIGATVGITAFADDTDVTDVVSYTLDNDAGGLFTIDSVTGVVTVAAGLDAETATSHTIIVRATSTDTSFTTRSFTINILDVNEVPIGPTSDANSAANEVAENANVGTTVGVTALAVDGDVTATVTYSLTSNPGGRFAIDANTGVVTVAGALDAETATSYTITVRATSSDLSFSSQSFVINILDVNEYATTAISDTNAATNEVAEDAVIGATVGITAFADDQDVTDTVSYTLDNDAGGLFTIDSVTGVVTVAAGLDAETATSLTIIVRATSTDTSFTTRSFTINILDVNEFPIGPVSDADAANDEVTENANVGTVVGVTALAVDTDVTATVTYSLDNDAGGLFAIDTNTGVITVAGSIDYETAHSYTVIVRATSSDTSFSTASFTINVLDVNDNPPTIDLDADNSGGAAGLEFITTFTEDMGPVRLGDADLTINDPDSPIINSVVITITNVLDGIDELLAVDTSGTSITAVFSGGVLTLSGADTLANYQQVLRTVTYENLAQNADLTDRVITFQSSDGTLTGPIATAIVQMQGSPDAPTLSAPANVSGTEDTTLVLSSSLGTLVSVDDIDSGTVELNVVVTHGRLTLASTAGLTFVTGDGVNDTVVTFRGTIAAVNAALDGLTYRPDLNFNGPATIQWTVTDPDGLSATHSTDLTIDAVNDAPTITGPTSFATDEDTPAVFSTATGTALRVDDVDAGDVQVTLTAVHGALTLNGATGLTFTIGDGVDDVSLTFSGSVSDVNAALDGLTMTPTADYNGPASLSALVDDLGNTGTGGALNDSLSTSIAVASVNDAPVGVADLIQTRNIDTILITSGAFTANDTDVEGDTLTFVLLTRPVHGSLVDSGNGAWLYVPDAAYFGPDTFTYLVSDGQLTSQPITVTIDISLAGGPNTGGNSGGGTVTGGVVNIAAAVAPPTNVVTQSVVTMATSTPVVTVVQEAQSDAFDGLAALVNTNGVATQAEARTLDVEGAGGAALRAPLFVRQDFVSRQGDSSITRLLTPMSTFAPFNVTTMNSMLDGLRDQVEMRWDNLKISTSSVTVTAVGLTAGYAIWALRGAHLVATLLTTMPAWWSIDPLPILTATQALKMREDDQEESLADIAAGKAKSAAKKTIPQQSEKAV